MHYMSGGQFNVPIVIRGPGGPAHQLAAQHSQSMEVYFYHVPGLKVVRPSTPDDAKGLLKSAIRDDNPVIFIESETLYGIKGEVPEDPEFLIPLGKADVKREGTDVTVVAYMGMMYRALEAAEELAKDGISVEIVDPRTLQPLDSATILESVRKTHRAVVVEAGAGFAGMGSELAAVITEQAFDDLDAPVERVTGVPAPMPYARNLEKAKTPSKERIIEAVRKRLLRQRQRGPLTWPSPRCSCPSSPRRWRAARSSSGSRRKATASRPATSWPRSRPTRPTSRWKPSARGVLRKILMPGRQHGARRLAHRRHRRARRGHRRASRARRVERRRPRCSRSRRRRGDRDGQPSRRGAAAAPARGSRGAHAVTVDGPTAPARVAAAPPPRARGRAASRRRARAPRPATADG